MSVESLQAKQAVIDEIKDKFERAKSAVVVDYMGITVEEADSMRKQLREAGIDYTVYKNTLVNRAIQGTEFESLAQVLSGPSAFAFGYEDATAPARELNSVIKKLNKMTFKAGIVEGEFYDQEGILAIAKLPSRDELIAKFMGSIKSPVSKFAYLLQAIADQKAEGGEPAPQQRNLQQLLRKKRLQRKKLLRKRLQSSFIRKHFFNRFVILSYREMI